MERLADGSTLHGGTYNTNLVATAAAVAALDELSRDGGAVYGAMEARGERLMAGLRAAALASGAPLLVQGMGTVFNTAFAAGGAEAPPAVTDYRGYAALDAARQRAFLRALQDRGVRVTARGTWFLSAAHSDADIDETLGAATAAIAII